MVCMSAEESITEGLTRDACRELLDKSRELYHTRKGFLDPTIAAAFVRLYELSGNPISVELGSKKTRIEKGLVKQSPYSPGIDGFAEFYGLNKRNLYNMLTRNPSGAVHFDFSDSKTATFSIREDYTPGYTDSLLMMFAKMELPNLKKFMLITKRKEYREKMEELERDLGPVSWM